MSADTHEIANEDATRAQCYALLARLLAAPPSAELLKVARALTGDATDLGQALQALSAVAQKTSADAAEREYNRLFIGLAQGELQPYASYYLTGFLHEKPLADLRGDMAALGVQRRADVTEPEDHIASVCEIMSGLITGAFGAPASLSEQQRFFERHLGVWAPKFFEDLEAAQAAVFYMPVGKVGRVFMAIERDAFAMESTT